MKCFECRGTGAADPDCWVCRGSRDVKWKRAVALGYSKADLEDLDDDGYCRCPRYDCRGDTCGLCEGDGSIEPGRFQIEVTRCLIYGLTQRLPPSVRRVVLPNGREFVREDDGRYLSAEAARYCTERKWGYRLNSLLGHEFYLYPKGEHEAKRRETLWLSELSGISLKHWLAWKGGDDDRPWWRDPIPLPHEIESRWADDGGKNA